jgi:hypothetical protein
VLNFGHGLAVQRLMSRVPDGGVMLGSSGILSLNSLESIQSQRLEKDKFYLLGIVEVSSVFEISLLGRALSNLQSTEVVLTKSLAVGSSELVLGRRVDSFVEFAVDGSTGSLSERLGIDVLRLNLRNVARVTGNMLSLNVVGRSSEPVISVLGVVAELKGFVEFISSRCVRVEFTLGKRRLSNSDIDIVVAGLVASLSDDLVNVSGSASVDVVLLGDVTCVARQVFFGIFDVSHY